MLHLIDRRAVGLRQIALGSQAPLTPDNHEAARAAMSRSPGDRGRIPGVRSNRLVVPTISEKVCA